jgi:carboxylesterase type B
MQHLTSINLIFSVFNLYHFVQSAAPTVNLGYVTYNGYQNSTAGISYYRGIPYAQPPVGALRWHKPRPIEASNNFAGKTITLTKIAPACYQSIPFSLYSPGNASSLSSVGTPQGQSEDCLILDVLVPEKPVSSSLPVLIQLHGGGYTEGNAQTYPGDALVNASNGQLIYVLV